MPLFRTRKYRPSFRSNRLNQLPLPLPIGPAVFAMHSSHTSETVTGGAAVDGDETVIGTISTAVRRPGTAATAAGAAGGGSNLGNLGRRNNADVDARVTAVPFAG